MVEKVYTFIQTDEKTIERIVDDEHSNINHVVLGGGEALPEHYSNSNVYLLVVRGVLSGRFDDQEEKEFPGGNIVHLPYNTKMNIRNAQEMLVDFFIFKAPHPSFFEDQKRD